MKNCKLTFTLEMPVHDDDAEQAQAVAHGLLDVIGQIVAQVGPQLTYAHGIKPNMERKGQKMLHVEPTVDVQCTDLPDGEYELMIVAAQRRLDHFELMNDTTLSPAVH